MAGEGGGTDQLRCGLIEGVTEVEPREGDRGDDVGWQHDVQVQETRAVTPGNTGMVADAR